MILDGTKERQGDFVFTANDIGEYAFCFSNDMSTFAEKMVDFEIAIENEAKAELPSKQGTSPEHLSSLEESLFKLSGQLSTISRNQKYFRTRENRNFSTVRSTESRIFNFSVIESLMMVTMSCLQVFVVRFFFQGARKGENDPPPGAAAFLVSPLSFRILGISGWPWFCIALINAEVYSRLCVNGACIFFFLLWTSLFALQQIVLKSMEL